MKASLEQYFRTNSRITVNEPDLRPIVAPCRKVPVLSAFNWLKKGWSDYKQVPKISLTYGLIMMVISVFITFLAYKAHSIVLAIALTAGFFFLGPIMAIGLYTLSRQISHKRPPKFLRGLQESKKNMGNTMVLSLMFLVVFLIWARAASMMYIFFPSASAMLLEDWFLFIGVGTLVGGIFAAVIFCVGAFSIPMLLDRDVDTVTAVVTSVHAVLQNKLAMLLWAFMIIVLIVIGIVTFYIGFVVLLPVVGHATWHAYKDTIDADSWDKIPEIPTS